MNERKERSLPSADAEPMVAQSANDGEVAGYIVGKCANSSDSIVITSFPTNQPRNNIDAHRDNRRVEEKGEHAMKKR